VLNLAVIGLTLLLPKWTVLSIPVIVTPRSWSMVVVLVLLCFVPIPGDIHHYRVRAEGDKRLWEEFRRSKNAPNPNR
jgi:hypothetical protein